MNGKSNEGVIKCLPTEGLITVDSLARFLDVRIDKLNLRLAKKGIKTRDLGANTRFRLVDIADLR